MATFKRLKVGAWRQFGSIDLDLTSQTTVLTGPNGCGKTTLLNLLSQHFGWDLGFMATPFISERRKKRYYSDFKRREEEELNANAAGLVGTIEYSTGSTCRLRIPNSESNSPKYNVSYSDRGSVPGIYIPSHQPALIFGRVTQIPADPKGSQQQYQEYQQFLLQTYGGGNSRNPGGVLKQSLIGMALFGYGNSAVMANPELRKLFEAFEEKLRVLLPPSLGFERLEVRNPDVVLITKHTDFSLDSMSGGVQALFSIAWQIHMYGAESDQYTVVVDEPENHLHPSMQRTLLPNLARAFPDVSFVAATHSPFIVTSDENARVYALLPDDNGAVSSQELTDANLAASPEVVLRDILDVESTLPVWVMERIKQVFQQHDNLPEGPERAGAIYKTLTELGIVSALGEYDPDSEG